MARIHDEHHADQRSRRLQIRAHQLAPLFAQALRHARITVARKVDEARRVAEGIEGDGLRATRCLAHARALVGAEVRVDGAGFAHVGTTGKGDVGRPRGWQVSGAGGRAQERRLSEGRHGGRGILIKSRLSNPGSKGMNRALALAAAMVATGFAFGQDKGPALAAQVCAACHAADGNSIAPANPKIAGQMADYLQKQLRDFKAQEGKQALRQSPVMNGMVATLSEADMKGLAGFYAAQALKPAAAADKDLPALGHKLLRRGDALPGIPPCAGCHRPSGAGIPAQFPRLAGQYAEDIATQVPALRGGNATNDVNGE